MTGMAHRGGLALLGLAALAASTLVACGGGGGDDGGQGQRVTDPAKVPSSTPISQGAPQKYEIHQDGSLVISGGGPTVTGTVSAGGTPTGSGGTYTVAAGDTCGEIATDHGITVAELIAANRASINADCTNLHEGDQLKIPTKGAATATPRPTGGAAATPTPRAGSRTYTVEPGDTCADIAANQGVSADAIIALNNLDSGCTTLQPGQVLKIPG